LYYKKRRGEKETEERKKEKEREMSADNLSNFTLPEKFIDCLFK